MPDNEDISEMETAEYAKYVERVKATKQAIRRDDPALELSRLILCEYYHRGRLDMLQELIREKSV